jgi:putative membrane-bound dehydrogenase-like protein
MLPEERTPLINADVARRPAPHRMPRRPRLASNRVPLPARARRTSSAGPACGVRVARALAAMLIAAQFAPAWSHAAAPGRIDSTVIRDPAHPTEQELRAFLTPAPRKSPAEAQKHFQAVDGFRMELVAAEPMVYDPVVAAFDEDGRLYVGEMRDYPFPGTKQSQHSPRWQGDQYSVDEYTPASASRRPITKAGDKPLGSIRLLQDRDGDGTFDESTVFADGLLWVAGIAPWKGGVFASAPPDLWYLKDTDADGKADVRIKVFTGFGTRNQQAMVNNLQFGLDHLIYGSTGGNGGEIRPGDDPAAFPVSVTNHDFRFAPDSARLERVTGTRQFGLTFDDWGNRFLCVQNAPCFHVVLPLQYLERNPYFTPRETIFRTSPVPTPLFRISPVERWRQLQSSRALAESETPGTTKAGVSHDVVDACAGVTIYRGGAYPKQYYGNVFIGDSVSNLVHRRMLVPHGVTFKTERADPNTEFVRSSDIWFRPVNFVNAPDGTLYCLDMSREYSESINIPPDIDRHLDHTTRDQGRIYRMAPAGFRSPRPPQLSRAPTAELVAALGSPHGWWRDTAHRLLFERQDQAAVAALERLVREHAAAETRVAALWSLHGLQSLRDELLTSALGDVHPGVRENAIRLAEPRLDASAEVRARIQALVSDPSPRVRLQAAFTVGQSRQWDQVALLGRLARENVEDSWIQSAILSSAADCSGKLLGALLTAPKLHDGAAGLEFLRQLALVIGAQNRPAEIAAVVDGIVSSKDLSTVLPVASALAEGLKRAGTSLRAVDARGRVALLLPQARAIAADTAQPSGTRRAAIELLVLVPYVDAAPTLLAVLDRKEPEPLQLAAVAALDQFSAPTVPSELLRRHRSLAPAVRSRALDAIVQRSDRLSALWAAFDQKLLAPADLSARQRDLLRNHRDAEVREHVTRILGAVNAASRQDVYAAFVPALQLSGNPTAGKTIFEQRCAGCHQLAGMGHEFGPDLAAARTGGKPKLLASIVDPNREVLPQYFLSTLELKEGESVSGIIRHETTTTVTVRQPGGTERTVSRAEIAAIKTLPQSLMPEGLEAGLTHQLMADLLQFILGPSR